MNPSRKEKISSQVITKMDTPKNHLLHMGTQRNWNLRSEPWIRQRIRILFKKKLLNTQGRKICRETFVGINEIQKAGKEK
jgi:hypothetical protein